MEIENMTEEEFAGRLGEAVLDAAEEAGDDVRVWSFEEAGLLTRNHGIVVRYGQAEFQVTVVRSR